ncbi:MAG: translation initiation factor IF-2 [Synergistaceae bacterium]|nr:translation initiation factor IF-2 [Synergistaceae bacterium]MBQ4402521.1 translation initiation factor IF-2 [Synergistaceae bacterium]
MNTPSNNKIRIYDLARKLNKSNKELLAVLQQLDIPVKSHSSSIDEDTAQIVENILAEASASKSQEKNQHGSEPSKSPERAEKREATDDKLPPERDIKPHDKHHNRDPHNPPQTPPSTKATVPVQPQPQPAKSQGGKKLVERPPIITVMGHVDHGKTTLLDNIRHSSIAAHEAGGITQHIGAYVVIQDGKQIVFLDTPGHEAFTEMRARGASVTDIVILVIGADDGVMPQTREAINHIKAAGVPLVVAINKIDKQGAKPDRVRQQLSELGIFTEGWGGEVGAVEISAKQGIGVPDLLERVLLEAEMQELKGNPDANPEGVVIEARLDKGKGPVATVIVKDGTLKSGDIVLFNSTWGKTRALFDWAGKGLKKAGPSTPVEILGLDGVPNPGETFKVVKTEREARDAIAAIRSAERDANAEIKKASFEDLYSNLEEGQLPHLNLVVKCDVQGSLEALCASLEKLATNEVGVSIVHRGVGRIAESDVMLASASNAVIVGFNVRPDGNAKRVADLNGVEIRIYSVIYDVMDDVKAAMAGLLKPVLREDTLGEVEVRKLFRVPKVGIIAGSHVTKGVVKRTAKVRVIRDGVVIWDGKIASLRHEKDEAKELRAGNDCGISLEGFQDFREGDILEVYEVIEEKRTL